MNIIVICDHSLVKFPIHDVLDFKDDNVFLLINSEILASEYDYIKDSLEKYMQIIEYENFNSNAMVEHDVIKINSEYQVDSIVALDECDVVRAGRLREYLQIDGQGYESALAYRDKILMKSYVSRNNLKVPYHKKITLGLDIIEFVNSYGYPVFVKPISSAGSVGSRLISCENDLMNFLASGLMNSLDAFGGYREVYEVEKFISSDLYCINGVVIDNKLSLFHAAKYGASARLEDIKDLGYFSVETISRANPLYEITRQYINNLIYSLPSPRDFFFHSEVFIDGDSNITLCEIASRPPGAGIVPMMSKNFGIDIFELSIKLQVSPRLINSDYLMKKSDTYTSLYASVLIHSKEGLFVDVTSVCPLEFVKYYKVYAKKGMRYGEVGKNSGDGIALIIVTAQNEVNLHINVNYAYTWFWENCIWKFE